MCSDLYPWTQRMLSQALRVIFVFECLDTLAANWNGANINDNTHMKKNII